MEIDKQKNDLFLDAFDWLMKNKKVDSQKQLAEIIGVSENTVSRIKRYNVTVSEETIYKMNDAFGNIFNMAYFRGRSHCLLKEDAEEYIKDHDKRWMVNAPSENTHESTCVQEQEPQPIDHSSLVNALLASKDETIAALNREMETKDKLIKSLLEQNAELKKQINEKEVRQYTIEMASDQIKHPRL